MTRKSAGILMYRRRGGRLEVLLVHMGGPFWEKRDEGAWSIPKGEYQDSEEEPLAAARREFREETGFTVEGPFLPLGTIRQKAGKLVTAWAAEGDVDPAQARSMTMRMEWPPHSGQWREVPEVDRAAWFTPDEARRKIIGAQAALINELEHLIESGGMKHYEDAA